MKIRNLVLGMYIKHRRIRRTDLTQVQLAERVGTTQSTIARWESGETVPDMFEVHNLAAALGVSVAHLMQKHKMISQEVYREKQAGWDATSPEMLALIVLNVHIHIGMEVE